MQPYAAKDLDSVCQLRTDHHDVGDFWILTDGCQVSLHEQKVGEKPSQGITIPRDVFNRMVRWYMRDQKAK